MPIYAYTTQCDCGPSEIACDIDIVSTRKLHELIECKGRRRKQQYEGDTLMFVPEQIVHSGRTLCRQTNISEVPLNPVVVGNSD